MGGEAGVEGSDGGGGAAAADCDVLVRQLRHCLTLDKIVGILVGNWHWHLHFEEGAVPLMGRSPAVEEHTKKYV